MGFMGYSTKKLEERAKKRGLTLDQYCKELEFRKIEKAECKELEKAARKETN